MIKTIPIEIDGFKYNIIQMAGTKAMKVLLKLSGFLTCFQNFSVSDDMGKLLAGCASMLLTANNENVILPLIEELLTTAHCMRVEDEAEMKGFNIKRHPQGKIHLDHFYGKDLAHLFKLLWEILKANYEDFLNQLKETFASNISLKNMNSPNIAQA